MRTHGCVLFLLTTLGLIWRIANAQRIPTPRFAGPYKVTIRSIGNTTEELQNTAKLWLQLQFTPPKPKQIQHTWGNFYAAIPLTDNQRIDIRLSQWSNTGWKRNAFIFKFNNACSSMFLHARCLIDLLYGHNEKKCPLPQLGLQEIKNQTFEAVFPQFPILPYNRYLFTMRILEKNETVSVVVGDGNASPK